MNIYHSEDVVMKLMSRGEANNLSVGDKVRMISNHVCTIIDLEYVMDSNNENQIVATVEQDNGIIKTTNLLMCFKI